MRTILGSKERHMKSVFFYSDYRQYMADYFEEKKSTQYGYSYQVFANKAGFKARDFIYRVIKGSKNLSITSSLKVAKAMSLKKKEIDFFQAMVQFNQCEVYEEKMHYYELMTEIKQRSSRTPKLALLEDDQIEFHATWYHAVVRSIIGIIHFTDNYHELASRVIPAITVTQAKKSVALLERLGLIVKENDGGYAITATTVSTGDTFRSMALHNYYRECFRLMENSMENVPRSERNISGLTLGISKKSYRAIVRRLAELRKEFLILAEDDEEADRVYNCTIGLYPVGDISKSGDE